MTDAHDHLATTPHRRADRHTTIEDVAREAGVSVATVSRALRGLPNVAATTRSRVAGVASDLNYRPNPAAARLAAGRTRTVTVGVPALSGWYFSTVVAGAEAVCNDAGYEFQVIAVSSHAERDRLLADDHQLEHRTDGLILVDIEASPHQAASLRRRCVALATIGTTVDGHPSVRIDDVEVGRMAGRHLLELGHRRLALIGGLNDDPMNFAVPTARRLGFEHVLAEADVPLDPSCVANGNFGVDGGREAMEALLDVEDTATGIFVMSDEMAFGALMELSSRGLVAGADISIIGVDDHEFSRVVGLTTIHQNVSDHGAKAATMLVSTMAADEAERAPDLRRGAPAVDRRHVACSPHESVGSPLELMVRDTTGPAPS